MIYSIVGTHKEVREKGLRELATLGAVTQYIYSEHSSFLESHIDAASLFGEVVVISCVQLGDNAPSKEILVSLLDKMKVSKNIFIIDEPFADIHLTNKLRKVSGKLFDAKEEKIKDTSVFTLCDSFARRDKKQAWIDFMVMKEKSEGEAIIGALWWKFQLIWSGVRGGRKSNFTLSECETIGRSIIQSSILAHRGEKDLMIEIERIILLL